MKKLAMIAIASLVLAFASLTANAANMKIGVVDMQKVLQKSPEAAKMNTALHQQFKPRQDKLLKLNKDLQAEQAKYTRNASVMSNKQKTASQKKIVKEQNELRTLAQKYQEELMAARAKDMHALFLHIQTAVAKVASKDHLDIVLDKQAATYVNPKLDITKQVVAEAK